MKTSYSYLFSFIFLVFSFHSIYAQTTVPEGSVNGVWTKANSPYLVQGDIMIPDNQTLTIEAGTRIEFSPSKYLMVKGSILAEGSVNDNIFFTVADTTGSWDMASFDGGWGGLRFIHFESVQDSSKLNYCTFEYGKAVSDMWNLDNGGAICVEDFDKLEISNCLFRNNLAGGPNFSQGGALAIKNSDIDLYNNTFMNNRAGTSGAVYVSVSDLDFRNNIFENNSAINGGVMYVNNSTLSFENDQFIGNMADNQGGVFFVTDYENSHMEFTSAIFTSNEAGKDGGVLEAGNANLTFNKCTFSDNTSGWIGGVFNIYNNCVLKLNNSDFTFNSAPIFGGVMGSYESDVEIDGCTMTDNTAGVLGGAVHSDWSQLEINRSTFERDSAGETGGGFWLWHCDAYFDDCEFNDNRAKYNYAAIGSDSSTVHIDNTTFDRNITVWGGAVGNQRGALHLTDCIFSENSADHGGAVNGGWTDLNMTNVIFEDNIGIWGGAIDAFNSNLSADYCAFARNEASDIAGAINYVVDTNDISPDKRLSMSLIGTRFMLNSSGNGMAAIYAQQFNNDQLLESVVVDDCLFENNTSGTNGTFRVLGEIPNVRVRNTIFRNNITHANRSIFGIQVGCKGVVENSMFINNEPRGAIVHDRSDIAFTNCVFYGNAGTGLDLRKGAVAQVTNTIFWNNGITAGLNAGAGDGCKLSINHCNIQFGTDSINVNDSLSSINWGTGNISSNPKFNDPSNNDFQLFYSSPCLEAGIGTIDVDGKIVKAPTTDIEGNPRPSPSGTNPDLGAYESPVSAGIEQQNAMSGPDLLHQNYPNPFKNNTTLSWTQSKAGMVRLELMDIQGTHLQTVINQYMPCGHNQTNLVAAGLSPGIYLCRLTLGSFVQTRPIHIVR